MSGEECDLCDEPAEVEIGFEPFWRRVFCARCYLCMQSMTARIVGTGIPAPGMADVIEEARRGFAERGRRQWAKKGKPD